MPNIPTTQETLQALDVLRRFVEGIDETFVGIRTKGQSPLSSVTHESAGSVLVNGGEPPSWSTRVLAILEDKGKYMSPKDIVTEYKRKNWTETAHVDNRIRSTLAALKKSHKIVHNSTNRTYKVKKEAN